VTTNLPDRQFCYTLNPYPSQVIGYIERKSAIHVARTLTGRKGNFVGQHSWARGYFVSTLGSERVGRMGLLCGSGGPASWAASTGLMGHDGPEQTLEEKQP
jgi:hypothetical protein